VGELVRPLVSVHRLVLITLDLIRQTVPTKAPVEAEMSTLINKRLFI